MERSPNSCDLLKIHYLCGDKYNVVGGRVRWLAVVICSKFITFAVTNTTATSGKPYGKVL